MVPHMPHMPYQLAQAHIRVAFVLLKEVSCVVAEAVHDGHPQPSIDVVLPQCDLSPQREGNRACHRIRILILETTPDSDHVVGIEVVVQGRRLPRKHGRHGQHNLRVDVMA